MRSRGSRIGGFIPAEGDPGVGPPSLWSPRLDVRDPRDGSIWSLSGGGPGLLGTNADPNDVPALWISPDGREWESVPELDGQLVSDVAAGDGLYVAIGHATQAGPRDLGLD
jgi:hypothetical protein